MRLLNNFLAFSFILIPLHPKSWNLLEYSSIPKHKLWYEEGLKIKVNSSAAPLIFPLKKKTLIKRVEFSGLYTGDIDYKNKSPGEMGVDDFPIRLGLVLSGEKTLNAIQRAFAADWIVKLYSLAKEGEGIERIRFLSVTTQEKPKFKKRIHPLSDLMEEMIVGEIKNGKFNIKHNLKKNSEVIAIWLSSDGDDTQSKFEITIKELKLITKESSIK